MPSLKKYTYKLKMLELHKDKFKYIFNPSILQIDDTNYCTFRGVLIEGKGSIESFFISNKDSTLINLSKKYSYIKRISDPKLVNLNNKLWITFNTGFHMNENKLFLFKYQADSGPNECLLNSRMRIEKNWGFFNYDNDIYAIYSIHPLIILKKNKNSFLFEKVYKASDHAFKHSYGIGSQPFSWHGDLYFFVHKKIKIINKRIYFGKLAKLEIANNRFKLEIDNKLWFHDYISLLGTWKKFNPNLISCSYISGLEVKENNFYISYGINDQNYSMAKIPSNEIY